MTERISRRQTIKNKLGMFKILFRWEICVKSTSGNDGTYLYFLDGSLTNAIGAMYAKARLSNVKLLQHFRFMTDMPEFGKSKLWFVMH
jgi:hypothetical protein